MKYSWKKSVAGMLALAIVGSYSLTAIGGMTASAEDTTELTETYSEENSKNDSTEPANYIEGSIVGAEFLRADDIVGSGTIIESNEAHVTVYYDTELIADFGSTGKESYVTEKDSRVQTIDIDTSGEITEISVFLTNVPGTTYANGTQVNADSLVVGDILEGGVVITAEETDHKIYFLDICVGTASDEYCTEVPCYVINIDEEGGIHLVQWSGDGLDDSQGFADVLQPERISSDNSGLNEKMYSFSKTQAVIWLFNQYDLHFHQMEGVEYLEIVYNYDMVNDAYEALCMDKDNEIYDGITYTIEQLNERAESETDFIYFAAVTDNPGEDSENTPSHYEEDSIVDADCLISNDIVDTGAIIRSVGAHVLLSFDGELIADFAGETDEDYVMKADGRVDGIVKDGSSMIPVIEISLTSDLEIPDVPEEPAHEPANYEEGAVVGAEFLKTEVKQI